MNDAEVLNNNNTLFIFVFTVVILTGKGHQTNCSTGNGLVNPLKGRCVDWFHFVIQF